MSTVTTSRPVVAGTAHRTVREAPPGLPTLPRTSVARPWDRVRFSGPTPARAGPEVESPHRCAAEPLPDPARWAGALVRSCVEVLLGLRPPAQLSRWLTTELYDTLSRRAGLATRMLGRAEHGHPAVVRRVRVCQVRPGVVEAAVVLHDGQKVRAAAARLEVYRGRWRATALEIG